MKSNGRRTNLIAHMQQIHAAIRDGRLTEETTPLIFVRVRSAKQMLDIGERLGDSLKESRWFCVS